MADTIKPFVCPHCGRTRLRIHTIIEAVYLTDTVYAADGSQDEDEIAISTAGEASRYRVAGEEFVTAMCDSCLETINLVEFLSS